MPRPVTEKKGFIPVPGVAQVDMIYQFLGQNVENVYHVLKGDGSAPYTTTELQALADVFENWESTQMAATRNANSELKEIVVRDLTSISASAITQTPVSPVIGHVAGVPLPGNAAFAIKWNTALRGRSFRGRTYHFGFTNGDVQGNEMIAANVAFYVAKYAGLESAVAAMGSRKLVVVSYASNKFWRDVGLATPITAPSADPHMDSQRRRLTGRGT